MIFLPNSDHFYHSTWIRAEYVGEGKVLPCSIIESANGYSYILNWISCMNIIAELPYWSISELKLRIHQNMMYQHDYAALKIKSCHYTLKSSIDAEFMPETCYFVFLDAKNHKYG